jgi:indole-3-acetate monooxygenase
LQTRGKLRLAATHMTRTAALVCRQAQDLCGGAAVFSENLLQRKLRDAQTMTAHMMIAPATYELAGRVLLGLPTDDTLV